MWSYFYGIGDVLKAFLHGLVYGEDDGDAFATVPVCVQYNDGALLRLASPHDAEVEMVGRKAQAVAQADGELAQQGLFAGDTLALQGQLYALAGGAVDQRAALVELAALATRVESQGDAGAVGRGNGGTLAEMDGGAAARGVALYQGHGVGACIAQPERALHHPVGLLNGAQRDGGKTNDNQ